MPTHDIARYAYPIIEVLGSEDPPIRERKSRTSTLRLSLCPPADPKSEAIMPWRRPPTVVEHAELPEKLDDDLVLLTAPNSSAATSYRLLRHRLLSSGNPRIIAVSSPSAGEGKSVCALNLALAFGEELGARVALLEGNLCRPWLARKLGFLPTECFAEQVANVDGMTRPWVMTKLDGTRVEIGAIDPEASEHPKFDRALFSVAVKDLRTEYDYIVIDTPPVLESADANLIGEAVEGFVLVARAKNTRRRDLRAAVDQLSPRPVFGLALLDSGT